MKGKLEFWAQAIYFHTDIVLTERAKITYHALNCGCTDDLSRPGYVTELFKITGVTGVQIEKHMITVYKGAVFQWKELVFHILDKLVFGLESPLGKIHFTEAPIKWLQNLSAGTAYPVVADIPIPNPYYYNLQVREKNKKKNPPKEE